MSKETKKSKHEQIAEARGSFLGTMGLEDIHYGDIFIFEDIAYRGIRPIRLLADAIDNLQSNGTQDGIDIFLNEIQKKCDELMNAFERWDDEEREAKKEKEDPAKFDLELIHRALEVNQDMLEDCKRRFDKVQDMLEKVSNTEFSPQDSAGAKQKA